MDANEAALKVIATRRSVRRFLPLEVPRQKLEAVVEAGRRAPSAHGAQPWRFVVLTDAGAKDKLARHMSVAYRRHLTRRKDPEAVAKSERAYRRVASAPALVLLCLDRSRLRAGEGRKKGEWVMGVQGLAAAAENMLLASHALGLGGCWRAAPLFCAASVRRALGLPGRVEPQILLELGYPDEKPRTRRLRRRDEVVSYNGC